VPLVLLVGRRIEAVVHFAACTAVGESVSDPARYDANNLIGSLGLLDRCRRSGVGRFVFSSTAAVDGEPERAVLEPGRLGKPIASDRKSGTT